MDSEVCPTQYLLQSVKTGKEFTDKGWTLDAPNETEPSLVRAVYEEVQLNLKDESLGLFKYADWLPVDHLLKGSAAPITYKSKGLATHLGLENLYITFSGYWPEKGASMATCSFKETEAYSVCGRLTPAVKGVLVVASAGNTARSFAKVCSENNIKLLLCVPEDNLDALWFEEPLNDNLKLICTSAGSDYFDAIHLSNMVCDMPGFFAEGGAKNVARRDGMGTTVLSAVSFIGRIPDYYFQAVGSGTGAIAAWEANQRLIVDGRFGSHFMKLMVSQNVPFTPIYDAWKAGSRQMFSLDDELAHKQVAAMQAKVLSNRKPPYPIPGGLYDALNETSGDVLVATNEEALDAAKLFEKLEGCDIHPASAVTLASLIKEVKKNTMNKSDVIMLNITGGGEQLFKKEKDVTYLKPDHIFDVNPDVKDLKRVLNELFK
jgi:cysteate synthase